MSLRAAVKAVTALTGLAITTYYASQFNSVPTQLSVYTAPTIVVQQFPQPTCPFTLPIQNPRILAQPVVKAADPTPELVLDTVVPNKTDDSPIIALPLPDTRLHSSDNSPVSIEPLLVASPVATSQSTAWSNVRLLGLWALNLLMVTVFASHLHPFVSSIIQPIIEELFPAELTVISVLTIACASSLSKLLAKRIVTSKSTISALTATIEELQVRNSEQDQRIASLDLHLQGYQTQVTEQGASLAAHRDQISKQDLAAEQLRSHIQTIEKAAKNERVVHEQTRQELEHSRGDIHRLEAELATMLTEIQTTEAERVAAEQEASSARIQRDSTASEWSTRFEKKKVAFIKLEKQNQMLYDENVRLQEQSTSNCAKLKEEIDLLVRLRRTSAAQEAEIQRLGERNEQTLSQLAEANEQLSKLNVTVDILKRKGTELLDLIANKEECVRSAEQAKAAALDDLATAKCVMEGLHEQAMVAAQRQKELSHTSQGYLKDNEDLTKHKERSDKLNADLRTEVERLAVAVAESEERMQVKEKEYLAKLKEAEEQNDSALEALSKEKERISTNSAQRIRELEEETKQVKEEYATRLKDVEDQLSLSRVVAEELERRSQDREREDIESMTNSIPSPPNTPPSSHNTELQKNTYPAGGAPLTPGLDIKSPTTAEQPVASLSASLLKVEIPSKTTSASHGPRSAIARPAPSSFHAKGLDSSVHNPNNRTSPTQQLISSGSRSRRSSHSGSDSSNRNAVRSPAGGQTRKSSNDLGKHFNTPKRRGPQGDFNQHDFRG